MLEVSGDQTCEPLYQGVSCGYMEMKVDKSSTADILFLWLFELTA